MLSGCNISLDDELVAKVEPNERRGDYYGWRLNRDDREIIRLWDKRGVSFAGHTFWPGWFVDYDEG